MQHVMGIVVPLRVVAVAQMVGLVAVMLQHQVNLAALLDGPAHLGRHLVEPCLVGDGVDGVEPQPVEAVFRQPVERVLDEEAPHRLLAEIDRGAPWRLHVAGGRSAGA